MPSGRPTVLVIHDEGESLDVLVRLFESSGFEAITAATGFRAQAHLESDRKIDVVVGPWDLTRVLGGDVYRWALQRRYDLRDRFVFIGSEVPPEFDQIVAGRCLALSMVRPAEVVRVALATIRRAESLELTPDPQTSVDANKPTLLLAEDEPVLLAVMAELLGDLGYSVTPVESGNGAIACMDMNDYDAIVADWHMDDGTGGDMFRWLLARKPYLASRVVFLSADENAEVGRVAPGRPMIRKGQDSKVLLDVISEIVREVRGDAREVDLEPDADEDTLALTDAVMLEELETLPPPPEDIPTIKRGSG